MEADWEVEIGGGAPIIDACWAGLIPLQTAPERAAELPEAANLPGLAEALVRLNGPNSPVWTSKCDVWPILDATDLDADELNASQDQATFGWACYIDLLPHNPIDPSPAADEASLRGSQRLIPGKKAIEATGPSRAEENLSWKVGRGFIPGVKAMELERPLGPEVRSESVSKDPNLPRLVTRHDFSRADTTVLKERGFSPAEKTIPADGALAPEGISTEAARLIAAAAHWCQQLRAIELTHCRTDLIVRQALIAPEIMDHGITAYLTACGRTSDDANATLSRALQAFAHTLCPDSTVE